MMSVIKWIIELAQKNPIMGLLGAVLVGISIMGGVCIHLNKVIEEKSITIQANERYYQRKNEVKDSLYRVELVSIQDKANKEVHDYLVKANADMTEQVKALEDMNRSRAVIYSNNEKVMSKNSSIIKKLKNAR